MLRCLGVNIKEKSAQRCSQSLESVEAILTNMCTVMLIKKVNWKTHSGRT